MKYDLDTQESQVQNQEVIATQESIEEAPEPIADSSERVVMDLGEVDEEEVSMPAPRTDVEPEMEGALEDEDELKMEAAIESKEISEVITEEEEDPMIGFPQMPEENHEERFEGTIESDTNLDEEPTVHVLEWDLEEKDEEARESIVSAEEAGVLPVTEEIETEGATGQALEVAGTYFLPLMSRKRKS